MGTMQRQYMIVETDSEDKGIKKVDKFIKKMPKKWQSQIHKFLSLRNGYVTYFFCWDGSKEGWDVSNTGDRLREEFQRSCKKHLKGYWKIYHVVPRGDLQSVGMIHEVMKS